MRIRNYVNEAKRTCVCVIDNTEYDFIRKIRKLLESQYGHDFGFRGRNSYLLGPIRGKAKCHPDDVWNENIGIELARQRALEKYRVKWNKEVTYLLETLSSMDADITELYIPDEDDDE